MSEFRNEAPPDNTVVVVRGGLAEAEHIQRTAELSQSRYGYFGVSVFLAFYLTVEDLVRQTPQLSPDRYKQLRTTTVGQLRGAGFALLASSTWPHYDVVLADLDAETVERLRACFGPAFPNPAGGERPLDS